MRRTSASRARAQRRPHSGDERYAVGEGEGATARGAAASPAGAVDAGADRPKPLSTCTPASHSASTSAVHSAGWCAGCDVGGCAASVSTTWDGFTRLMTAAQIMEKYAADTRAASHLATATAWSDSAASAIAAPGAAGGSTPAEAASLLPVPSWPASVAFAAAEGPGAPTARALALARSSWSASGNAEPEAAQARKPVSKSLS